MVFLLFLLLHFHSFQPRHGFPQRLPHHRVAHSTRNPLQLSVDVDVVMQRHSSIDYYEVDRLHHPKMLAAFSLDVMDVAVHYFGRILSFSLLVVIAVDLVHAAAVAVVD